MVMKWDAVGFTYSSYEVGCNKYLIIFKKHINKYHWYEIIFIGNFFIDYFLYSDFNLWILKPALFGSTNTQSRDVITYLPIQ